ncbi:MAG: Unknown protein [uncultured Thiotrichaceae bacterium]|uniref:Uncharacterized protein n=1 Tax=uncultured Thiotrichaceae bacterium TaxID=298394 RepID=A0A6S6U725_9GAMM|nr:MAG: Unknown protein [uncultured Thiotrichaceae bacterium]
MKAILRSLFSPLLTVFESGAEDYEYKPSHRTILLVMGSLFLGLAALVLWSAIGHDIVYFLPVVVFGTLGFVSLIIGLLGNDRAVAKIWSSRR